MKKRSVFLLFFKKVTKTILKAVIFLFFCLLTVFLIIFIIFTKDFPRPERFLEREVIKPTEIYDRTGKILLYSFGEEKRKLVPLEEVSPYLKNAIIVAEDANFYHHFGLDIKSVIRAILVDLKLKKPVQGASTISQQLIRSVFLSNEKTIQRKFREALLTLELERRYSKDQILEWYLNQISFGSNCYGVASASQFYFGKTAKELTLEEAAVLAALIKAPSSLSPFGENKEKLLERKNYILERMFNQGYITQQELEEAKNKEIKFQKTTLSIKAPHFVFYVLKKLNEEYGEDFLKESGFKVYTTLDWELQEYAEKLVKEKVEQYKSYRVYNGALVALDPNSGEILALVGSADYFKEPYPPNCQPGSCLFEPEFDVATLGNRQPGSAFKPFAYLTAFNKGYSDKYIVIDEETNFGVWGGKPYIPQNYDGRFRGPVTLREALAQSLNVPSVKVFLYLAGIKDTIETAKNFGISTLKDYQFYGPSLVLGGGEVKLIEMVSAYGVFATEGIKNTPISILKIEDKNGNIIKKEETNPKRIFPSQPIKTLNSVLSDNEARAPIFGFNSPLFIPNYNVSVKTGTTQNFNDGWCIGYTKKIVVGVWMGNNDNSPTLKPAVMSSAVLWHDFMLKVLEKGFY